MFQYSYSRLPFQYNDRGDATNFFILKFRKQIKAYSLAYKISGLKYSINPEHA